MFLVELAEAGSAGGADGAVWVGEWARVGASVSKGTRGQMKGTTREEASDAPLLAVFNGVLHPKHVTVLTANFISPPIVGVAIEIVRVCSPERSELAFAPRMGSKIRMSGFESWLSR